MSSLCFLSLCLCLTASGASRVAGSAKDVSDALRGDGAAVRTFDLAATVTYACTNRFDERTEIAAADASGSAFFVAEKRSWPGHAAPSRGAKARLQGFFETAANGLRFAVLTNCAELAVDTPPAPIRIVLPDLNDGNHFYIYCRRRGTLRDVAVNEADPDQLVLHIHSQSGQFVATVPVSDAHDYERPTACVSRQVSVFGIFVPYDRTPHSPLGYKFKIASTDQIHVDSAPAQHDLAEQIDRFVGWPITAVTARGRSCASGWIVAVWQRDCALLRMENGFHVRLRFAQGVKPPRYGEYVRVVGLPTSDLFSITMFRASWTPQEGPPLAEGTAAALSIGELTHDGRGRPRVDCGHLGHPVSVTGTVRRIKAEDDDLLMVEDGGGKVAVDISAWPDLAGSIPDGCRIAVTGTCILRVDAPPPNELISRIRGLCLVPRTSADLTVVSSPPWWKAFPWRTSSFVLAVLCLAVGIWNLALRRLAEKRGTELAGEKLARAVSDLKVYERTRLAVELHDSIAQTLTGIAFELDTAELEENDFGKLRKHLGTASRALKSCRAELRNSLWDLRNETLENDDMETAIRKTLGPHAHGIRLSVRFAVPRERISDNSAHAMLRIIRELTLNAIRHGKATSVRIAGAIDGALLRFSVADDGCGFDPENCPGDDQGHYGLLGIRERINAFEGNMEIDSRPGHGTKVTITLTVPQEQKEADGT